MPDNLDLVQLRRAIRSSRAEWQRHALERMVERDIRRSDVLEAILSGEEIEDYPIDRPFPSALFLGWIGSRPLHVVVAYDSKNERAYVITAYEPDLLHFEPGFRKRRTP